MPIAELQLTELRLRQATGLAKAPYVAEFNHARVKQLAIDFLRSRGKPVPVGALSDPDLVEA